MIDLHIPDEALTRMRRLSKVHATEPVVSAIAAPIVAAELRRLAAEWEDMHKEHIVPRYLRRRADELDGGAA